MAFSDNPVVYLTRKEWEHAKGNRRNMVIYAAMLTIANCINFIEPLIIAFILNVAQEQGITAQSVPRILWGLGLYILMTLLFWAFHGPARIIENRNAFLVRANYKQHLLDGVMALPAQWHTDHHSGDTIDRIDKATDALFGYSTDTFFIIESIVRFAASYIALAYFNLHSSYIVLFMVTVTCGLILRFDKVLVKDWLTLYKEGNAISAKIFDVISNITTVIILRIEKLMSKAIFAKIMSPFGLYNRTCRMNETKWFLVSMCNAVMVFLVIATYLYSSVRSGTVVMIGTLFALYEYVQRINGLFYRFAWKYSEIVMQKTAVSNVEEIAKDFRKVQKQKKTRLDSGWEKLEIRALRFSYEGSDHEKHHLDDVSLTILRGQKIALIGESGSGKTTMLKVMRQLYEPKSVELYLDGKPLPNCFSQISSNITLIPQDPEIFATTVRDNITMGVSRRMSSVRKYTDMACFTEVAHRLPHGFESSIVERGVNLSGGEKQRLALARGLLACEDKAIVLLDEPTSSVDSRNELKIYKNIFDEFADKTIISSIHRLHLLKMFDVIYFFKDGRIIATGSFDELLASSAEFREAWRKYSKAK